MARRFYHKKGQHKATVLRWPWSTHLVGSVIQLSSARLNGAQLDSTELSSTQRSSARLNGAQLDSVELSSTQRSSARLSWAQLDSTELSSTQLSPAQFAGPSSVQPRNSTEASIRGYDLRCVQFHLCTCRCTRASIIISCLPIQNIVYPISTNPPPFFLTCLETHVSFLSFL